MQGPGKIFQHLGHFFPSAFFTKTFTFSISSNIKRFLSFIIFFASAFDVIKLRDASIQRTGNHSIVNTNKMSIKGKCIFATNT